MHTEILHFVDGAKSARGTAVIIDVLRAASVQCFALENGAECILAVGELEQAYVLKRAHPEFVQLGERGLKTGRL